MTQAPLHFESGRPNFFIEAAAGTGKTTAIVGHVLRILLDDPRQHPDRIVLITFTEKAAGEIAERVRDALVELRESLEGPGACWPPGASEPVIRVDEEDRERWREACAAHLGHLDRLRSQTIHAFCQSILTQFPFEAGVDPSFRILEGFERGRLHDEIWLDWLEDETIRSPRQEQIDRWDIALEGVGGPKNLRDVIFSLIQHRALLEDTSLGLGDFAFSETWFMAALRTIRDAPESQIAQISDEKAAGILRHLRNGSLPPREREAWIAWLQPIARVLSEVNLFRKKGLEELVAAFKVIRGSDKPDNLYALLVADRTAAAVLALSRRFLERLEQAKDRAGVLDFDDLLIRTERFLRKPENAQRVRERFDFLLVDEFQDTDRLQAEIVTRLSRNSSGDLARGRVVLVGDPKQSIYSFRRADPETYGEMLSFFTEKGASTPKLEKQYRSDPRLVDALNVMFSRLFSLPSDPNIFRPGYIELRPGLSPSTSPATPIRVLRAGEKDEQAKLKSSHLQADAVVSFIQRRIKAGESPESFAILLRKMTEVQPYLDALAGSGIEYLLPKNSSVLERRPGIDLVAGLRAIAAPWDRGAEISAARGLLFALTDDEIAHGVLARDSDSEGSAPWKAFRAQIRAWRQSAITESVSATVERVIRESGIEVALRLLAHSRTPLEDLDSIRLDAATFDREAGGSLALFVEEMLRRRDRPAEGEPAVLDEKAGGVRIMTVHAAKGLEFETVILPELRAMTKSDSISVYTLQLPSRLYLEGQIQTMAAQIPAGSDAGAMTPSSIRKARGEAENDRLFYVAVTRARREVVFVIDPDERNTTSFMKPFQRIFGLDSAGLERLWPPQPGTHHEELSTDGRPLPVVFERPTPARKLPALASRLIDRGLESRISEPLPLASALAEPPSIDRGELLRSAASMKKRKAGILLHRLFEVWDWNESSAPALLEALARESRADPKDVELVQSRLATVIASSHFSRLAASEMVGREVPIHFIDAEGIVRQGRIDWLGREKDRWIVVDYKSGQSTSPARLEKDREQVVRYCSAIRSITGEPRDGVLWYIDVEGEKAVEVGEG